MKGIVDHDGTELPPVLSAMRCAYRHEFALLCQLRPASRSYAVQKRAGATGTKSSIRPGSTVAGRSADCTTIYACAAGLPTGYNAIATDKSASYTVYTTIVSGKRSVRSIVLTCSSKEQEVRQKEVDTSCACVACFAGSSRLHHCRFTG